MRKQRTSLEPGTAAYARRYHPSGTCAECGQWVDRLSLDHVVPISLGGQHDLSNLQWLCWACHHEKSNNERRAWMEKFGKSDAFRAKIREALSDPLVREKLSASSRGRTLSAASREKVAAAQRGVKRSSETRMLQSQAAAARWARMSPEERRAIGQKSADTQRGRKRGPMPDEQRRKVGESQRLKWASGTRKPSGSQ